MPKTELGSTNRGESKSQAAELYELMKKEIKKLGKFKEAMS